MLLSRDLREAVIQIGLSEHPFREYSSPAGSRELLNRERGS